ncbi:MAG: DUF547 domain-containing protein [Geminicoccaceae bacterium]
MSALEVVSRARRCILADRLPSEMSSKPPLARRARRSSVLWKLLASILGAVLLCCALGAHAAPRPVLWERWLRHDASSSRTIDHQGWAAFLTRYVRIGADGVHRVAYGVVTPADRAALKAYLEHLASVPISTYNRTEQEAYWINLYNALTVDVVLEHYPVASIRDIRGSPRFLEGPWREPLIEVEGESISLNDIEHHILRPIWHDPRVLYALSCGALSCPDLRAEPYRGASLGHQLDEAAMAYVNDARCLRIDHDRLVVSSLFRWYRADFGGSDGAVIHHLLAYAEPGLAMRLQRFEEISDDSFDWRLNDATP